MNEALSESSRIVCSCTIFEIMVLNICPVLCPLSMHLIRLVMLTTDCAAQVRVFDFPEGRQVLY